MEEQEIKKVSGNINSITYQKKDEDRFIDICVSQLGRTVQVSNNDFLEYGTKFLIEKSKYNDKIKQNLFNKYTQNLIGSNIEDIEVKSDVIFPTKVEEVQIEEPPLDRYFGLTITDNVKLIVLNVKILSIDDRLVFKDSKEESLFTILFKDYYYDNSNNRTLDENSRILIYLMMHNDEVVKVNLAKTAWIDDITNPLRNLREFYLRKDELKNLVSYINPIKNIGNNRLIDTTSNTLVGNDFIEKSYLPIFNRKKSPKQEVSKWNKSTTYNYGEESVVGEDIWTSIVDENTGNFPLLSQTWEKRENLYNYYTDRFLVDFNKFYNLDIEPGNIYPSKDIAFFKDDKEVSIIVDTNPGILLKSEYITAIDDSGQEVILTEGKDYTYSTSQNYENLIVFDKSYFNTLRTYEKLLFDISRVELALSLSFFKVETDANGVATEILLNESVLIPIISLKYVDVITNNSLSINLGDDREAIELVSNNETDIEVNEGDESIKLSFEDILIDENDYAAEIENVITFDNYPSAYIYDELVIEEKNKNSGYVYNGKTYLLDYVIDNKGNRLDFVKNEDGYNYNKIIISPEPVNEINSIINYKIYLTEQTFKIDISVSEVGDLVNSLVFEKYQYSTTSDEPVIIRYYVNNSKSFKLYIKVEENEEMINETAGENKIDGICNYEWLSESNDEILVIKFSAIKKSFKLICK